MYPGSTPKSRVQASHPYLSRRVDLISNSLLMLRYTRVLPRASLLLRYLSTSRPTFVHTTLSTRTAASLSMSFPKSIKAIVVPKHGDVDVIELAEVPFPEQQPGEVLIKVSGLYPYYIGFGAHILTHLLGLGELRGCELH